MSPLCDQYVPQAMGKTLEGKIQKEEEEEACLDIICYAIMCQIVFSELMHKADIAGGSLIFLIMLRRHEMKPFKVRKGVHFFAHSARVLL